LAGLIDGDGWISAPTKQKHVIITFHIKDVTTAYWIKKKLRFGSVYLRHEANSCTFSLTSITGLIKLLHLVGNKLQLERKREAFIALSLSLNLPISHQQKEVLSLKNYYLAGLLDADGNIDIYILFRPQRNRYEIRLRIRLELQVRDKFLIESVLFLLGGHISFRRQTSSWRYDSVSMKNCGVVLSYLDQYQLLSKYKEYRYLKKAFFLTRHGQHQTTLGLKKIFFYQQQLRRLKR
jgi:hypothetical protein